MRLLTATVLLLGALLTPGAAHAYSFKLFTILVGPEAGFRINNFRQTTGTRKTPSLGIQPGIDAEVVLFSPRYYPSRLSLTFGFRPDAQGTPDFPVTGRRPGPHAYFIDPGILKDLALGAGLTVGARYRWETQFSFVPFVDADLLVRSHKPLGVAPPHVNLAVRAGGGLEYWPIHLIGLFAGIHIHGGPRLWPLDRLLPMPEVSTEFTGGIRLRAF